MDECNIKTLLYLQFAGFCSMIKHTKYPTIIFDNSLNRKESSMKYMNISEKFYDKIKAINFFYFMFASIAELGISTINYVNYYIILYYVVLYYIMLCCVIFYYIMLRYIILRICVFSTCKAPYFKTTYK